MIALVQTFRTKVLGPISAATMLAIIAPQHALAGLVAPDRVDTGGNGDVEGAATVIINAILNLLGLIAVVVIVIAGLRLIVGGADEAQREKARNTVLYAVIGLILVLFAKAIVAFVASKFTT